MIKLESIKKEQRCGKVIYVLPGRRTTESAQHAKEVLKKIQNLLSSAEALQKNK